MSSYQDTTTDRKVRVNKPRVFTAVFIVAGVLTSIYFGSFGMSILFALITIFGGYELSNILEKDCSGVTRYLHIFAAVTPLLFFRLWDAAASAYLPLLIISLMVMLFLIINLWGEGLPYSRLRFLFTLLYWGLPFGLGSYFLYYTNRNAQMIGLGIILLLWISDTMAYFTGKALGKNKLFPSVSPGKTIEGSLGAGLFSVLIGAGYANFIQQDILAWVFIGVVVWIIGTLGDLVESKIKRVQDVKDSGSILPGHGGFLDRFDSLVMVIPFLLLVAYLFG